ncbi:MAG: hypothetical protein ABFC96_02540 [Thermoguttaceae bacterium]
MKTIHVQEAASAQELFDQTQGEPLLLQGQSGRAFVLVEVDRDDAETLVLAGNPDLERILDRSRGRARREGWLTTERIRQELDKE